MGIRGRASASALEIVQSVVVLERPGPPAELTEEQAEVWFTVVNQLPADWFSEETLKLLQAYCVAVSVHDRIAVQLKEFKDAWLADEDGLKRFDRLTKILARQTSAIKALATSMRITQQSRYGARGANSHASKGGRKPWEGAPPAISRG